MSLTSVIYSNNYLPDLLKVAIWVGTTATSSVLLFGVMSGAPNRGLLDWRDVAMWGTIGTVIGAQFGVTNKPWFR